jgi:hypothetical protein
MKIKLLSYTVVLILICIVVLINICIAGQTTVYKYVWKDSNGTMCASDQPPPEGTEYKLFPFGITDDEKHNDHQPAEVRRIWGLYTRQVWSKQTSHGQDDTDTGMQAFKSFNSKHACEEEMQVHFDGLRTSFATFEGLHVQSDPANHRLFISKGDPKYPSEMGMDEFWCLPVMK